MQKTNFKTRLLALLTAAFMLVMCVPFAAFADAAEVTVSFNRLVSDPNPNPYLTQVLTEANPEVVAPALPEGYNAWTSDSTSKVLKAGDKLTYADVKDTNGYVNFNPAKVEEEKPEVKKTVNINLNTNNTKGVFVGYDGAETISFENLPEIGDPIALPKVKANDGYKFTGWKVEGAGEAGYLDADATEFGYTGAAHFPKDSTVGYITLTAQFEEVKTEQPEETKKTVEIYLNTDNTKGVFVGYDGAETISFKNLPEIGDPIALPEVKANDGYKFTV